MSMRPTTKKTDEINSLIRILIEGERMRDQRSLFKKIRDDIVHDLKVFLERCSKIN
ncbi:MAG: hypothetical protein U9P70_01995 [Patescibacteria group bacterium]|nr:hypothetical protein [Patescibacteria group bacterium]